MKTVKPEDFGTMHCGDGLTIDKGAWYVVRRHGDYAGNFPTLWEAINYVEAIRGN